MKTLRGQEVVIINFTFDYNGRYEVPMIELCNPDRTQLYTLSSLKNLVITPRFNSVSEVKFIAHQKYNNIEFEWYNQLNKNRLIHVEGFGYFVIVEVNEVIDGRDNYKEIVAYSYEYTLNYKGVNLTFIKASDINTLTYSKSYKFYDNIKPEGTLLYELFKICPNWSIKYVSADLCTQYRTFQPSSQGLYGFLMNEIAQSYEAIFMFDFEKMTVSAYSPKEVVKNTDIIFTFDNLIKSVNIKELSDDIYTSLRVNGADNLSIARINPTGTNKLFKFDYYMNDAWLGKNKYAIGNDGHERTNPDGGKILLKDYVLGWQNKVKEQMENSDKPNTYGYLLNFKKKLNRHLLISKAVYKDAETQYNSAQDLLSSYLDNTSVKTETGNTTRYNYYKKIVRACEKNLDAIKNGGRLYKIYSDLANVQQNSFFDTSSSDIGTPNGDSIYNGSMSSSLIPSGYKYFSIASLNNKIGLANEKGEYPSGSINKYLSNIVNTYAYDKYFSKSEQLVLDPYVVETEYADSSFIVTDEMNIADYSDTSKKVLTTEGVMTIEQLMSNQTAVLIDADYVAQQLLKQGYSVLDKISTPSFSFDLDMVNFLFNTKYEWFLHQLQFGAIINVEIKDGEWVYPFLQEMEIDYENPKNFSVKFGNRFRLSDAEWSYADLHNETLKTSQTVGSTLPVAAEPVMNGTVSAVENYINNSLIAANQSIKSTTDNEFVFGGYGLRGRKVVGKTSSGEPEYGNEQIWINNNLLCFTDDNWNTVKSALGKVQLNGNSSYGLVAEHIVGKLVAGEQLLITNKNSSFTVDGSGATLNNASFTVQQDNGSSIKINSTIGLSITNSNGKETLRADTNGNVSLTGQMNVNDGSVGGFTVASDQIYSNGTVSSIAGFNHLIQLKDNGTGRLGSMTWDSAGNITINNLTANNGTFKGTVYASKLSGQLTTGQYGEDTISYGKLTSACVSSLRADLVTTNTLEANYAKLGFVNAMNAELGRATANIANIQSLVANKADISSLNATNAKINNLQLSDLWLSGHHVVPMTQKIDEIEWGENVTVQSIYNKTAKGTLLLPSIRSITHKTVTVLKAF